MAMQPISIERAMEIAKRQGLKPALVRGTERVQFTNGKNRRLAVIDWDRFREILEKRKLQVHESGGWMKIQSAAMRKKR